ncbi:hypothetical protein [Streptomyces sp. NPDC005955]|uniref:TetR/AcrR family transcriptional regulator n=1 Tax=Streptomyces sp. NPDC005955 TaxID=3364738 RepID=UPI0036A2BBFC
MAASGPDAITLRAVARDMGVTAGAIHGYYATRDDLITTLIRDVQPSRIDTLEAARDTAAHDDPAGRVLSWARAFRERALADPEGFRLIYGDPVPGYAAPEAQRRACSGPASSPPPGHGPNPGNRGATTSGPTSTRTWSPWRCTATCATRGGSPSLVAGTHPAGVRTSSTTLAPHRPAGPARRPAPSGPEQPRSGPGPLGADAYP